MRAYKICFIASAAKLSAIVGAIENEVSELDVKQIEVADEPVTHKKHINPEMKTFEAILKDYPAVGTQIKFTELQATMVKYGFKPTSASPAMSELIKRGLFVKLGKRDWKRIK